MSIKCSGTMRSTNIFRDQVDTFTNWFKAWSECEQTVALYSLLKKVKPIQGKFLAQVLEQSAAEFSEIETLESEANDSVFISRLCNEPQDKVITDLLNHMLLLRAGNERAKVEYLNIIPKVLSHSIENGVHIEESRQLLSYSLIHPAMTSEERSKFTLWLGYLEEKYSIYHQSHPNNKELSAYCPPKDNGFTNSTTNGSFQGLHTSGPHKSWEEPDNSDTHRLAEVVLNGGSLSATNLSNQSNQGSQLTINGVSESSALHRARGGHIPLHATTSAPSQFRSPAAPQHNNTQQNLHAQLCHTLSVSAALQPLNNVSDWLRSNDKQFSRLSRSQSITSDHAPLSPQSSVTSSGSGSDSHHDDGPQPVRNSFLEEGSGMRDVPIWLKTLRLHKYSYLFQQLTYDDMLGITEEWLEAQSVTKGARHKIVVNINKLKARQEVLRTLEKDIMDGGSIKNALTEMKNMLNTPLKQYSPSKLSEMPSDLPDCSGDASSIKSSTNVSPPSSPSAEGDSTTIPEGDLPGQFTRLMGKVCTQLLVSTRGPDEDCFSAYLSLIDKCINHEAFSPKQKKLLATRKQQAQRICPPSQLKYSLDHSKRKGWGNTYPIGIANRTCQRTGHPHKAVMTQWKFGSKRSIVGGTTSGHSPLSRNHSVNPAMFSRPGLFEGKQAVVRTQSEPLRTSNMGLGVLPRPDLSPSDTEINARLDSLCLSMTEHALGSSDVSEKNSTF